MAIHMDLASKGRCGLATGKQHKRSDIVLNTNADKRTFLGPSPVKCECADGEAAGLVIFSSYIQRISVLEVFL